jgi:hypothetical protein
MLTGTPLQNDLVELFNLMHFLLPHVFGSQLQEEVVEVRQGVHHAFHASNEGGAGGVRNVCSVTTVTGHGEREAVC